MKIINIDVDSELIVKNVYDTESKVEKKDSNSLKIPTGNYKTIMLNFNFISPKFEEADLKLFASFNNDFLDKPVMAEVTSITENEETYEHACYVPEELLKKVGKVKLGLFGYILNEETQELEKRYSLRPISSEVVLGSFQEDMVNAATPTPTVFEIYFQQVKDMADQVAEDYKLVRTAIENVKNENITDFNKKAEAKKTSLISDFDTHATEKEEEVKGNIDNHVATKIEEYDAHASDLIGNVADTRNELERVKNDVLETGEATGSSINIKDSTLAEFQEISVDGVCKQITTKGNQLIDFSKLMNFAGVSSTFKNDVLTVVGSENSTIYNSASIMVTALIKNNPGKTIYLKYDKIETLVPANGTIVQLTINYNDGTNPTYNILVSMIGTIKGYAIPSDTSNIESATLGIYTCNNSPMIVNTITITKPMLTFEENAEYEPYTGLQASPSPSYPQEIEVIEEDFDVTSCGKNMLDLSKISTSTNMGIEISYNEQTKKIRFKGTATNTYPSSNRTPIFIPKGIYTFNSVGNANAFVWLNDKDGVLITTFNNKFNKTITIPKDAVEMRVGIEDLVVGQTYDLEIGYQLVKGDIQSECEPYQETKVTFEIPEGEFVGKLSETIKDQIKIIFNEEDGKYHAILKKKVGKVVLDSSYFVDYKTPYNNVQVAFKSENDYGVRGHGLCDFYQYGDSGNVDKFDVSMGGGSSLYFHTPNESINTTELFKEWLDENKPTVYYQRVNPYEIDLGVVDIPLSYSPETNLFITHELEALINAKYYRNFEATVRNLQVNEKALKDELVEIQSKLNTLATNVTNLVNMASVESEVVE